MNSLVFCSFLVAETGPGSPSSFSTAAVAWLFPSENFETLRRMSSKGERGGGVGVWSCEVWCRRFRRLQSEFMMEREGFGGKLMQMVSSHIWPQTQFGKRPFFLSSSMENENDRLACSDQNKLVCLFWPQAGKFIHEEEARLPGLHGQFIWLTLKRLGFAFLCLASARLPGADSLRVHYRAADDVVNGLRLE